MNPKVCFNPRYSWPASRPRAAAMMPTRVYQGKVSRVAPGLVNAMQRVTIGDLKPDLTIILDVPVEIGLKRAAARRGGAGIIAVTAVDDLPPPRPDVAGDEGFVGGVVGAVTGHVHRLREGGCLRRARRVTRAVQVERNRATCIRRGRAESSARWPRNLASRATQGCRHWRTDARLAGKNVC